MTFYVENETEVTFTFDTDAIQKYPDGTTNSLGINKIKAVANIIIPIVHGNPINIDTNNENNNGSIWILLLRILVIKRFFK